MKKVVVGLSGGVDSSVAALLLKEQGYEVEGLFMVNWHDRTGALTSNCTWEDDWLLAQMVAKSIDIPISKVDLSDDYRSRVVEYMFSEYEKGRTPNPDVLCNREIKFDVFLKEALKLGADYVATGHYCRKGEQDGEFQLLAGLDGNKDQSYFLCQLTQQQLAPAMFPVGHLEKGRVRELAVNAALPTAARKDSQGICFVGKVDLPTFLQQKLEPKKGKVIEVFNTQNVFAEDESVDRPFEEQLKMDCAPFNYGKVFGKKIGEHNGAHYYTVGQRKGLSIGGYKEPLFVIGTNVEKNIVFVGEGHNHPGLNRKGLFVKNEEIHFLRPSEELAIGEQRTLDVRIRYRQPLQKASLFRKEEGLYIVFEEKQRAITPGQFVAWYNGDDLLGSGVINA